MAALTLTTSREVDSLIMPAALPLGPDGILLALCAEFRRQHAGVQQASHHDDAAQEAAWTARQEIMDEISGMRPLTEAGRAAKAAVAVAVLLEVPLWERSTEWQFTLSAFRAEAAA